MTLGVGRMISGSKSTYVLSHPDHKVIFNANICSKSRGKFWHGDLDLMVDATDLAKMAADEGEDIYILRERDARFSNEANPLFDLAVALVTPAGEMKILETA